MSDIASFHIQKTNPAFAFLHNARKIKPEYLIDTSKDNECNNTEEAALKRYLSLLNEALSNYTKRTNQRIQVKDEKIVWEAVLNLTSEHTLKDVLRLAKVLEDTYGWQQIQVAIHRDEGYVDEITGERKYNYHAHIIFFMLSKEGIYMFKKRDFPRTKMSEMQTLVANTLGMTRGKKSNKVRLSAAQYRQVAKEKFDLEFQIMCLTDDFDNIVSITIQEQEQRLFLEEEIERMKEKIRELENTQNSDDNIKSILDESNIVEQRLVNKIKYKER